MASTPSQDGARAAAMLLALGRLRPPTSEIMVLNAADSPAVSSSASPKRRFDNDDDDLVRNGQAEVQGTTTGAPTSTSTSISSASSTSNEAPSSASTSTSGSSVVVAAITAAKPVLHFRGADSVCSSGLQSEEEGEGEGEEKKRDGKKSDVVMQGQLRSHHDDSNSPSFVLGDARGWCDSDSDSSPCCSSPGSLSLSKVKAHSSRRNNTFHLINNSTSNSHNSKHSVADFAPSDRIENDVELQECSPSDSVSKMGGFLVPGQLEARKRMLARSQQCVVCMETKEHTFVPVHRQASTLQCQGHRFCSDCWIEFLQHRFRQYFAKQTSSRGPSPLPCPVCRSEIYVPDCWGTQCTLPKCWREFPEATGSARVEELPSVDVEPQPQPKFQTDFGAEFANFGTSATAASCSSSSSSTASGGAMGWISAHTKPAMEAWQPEQTAAYKTASSESFRPAPRSADRATTAGARGLRSAREQLCRAPTEHQAQAAR